MYIHNGGKFYGPFVQSCKKWKKEISCWKQGFFLSILRKNKRLKKIDVDNYKTLYIYIYSIVYKEITGFVVIVWDFDFAVLTIKLND